MEAAVQRVVVLALTGRAHGELRHRGLRAVVGDAAGDGEARTAVGAVQKGIAVAAVEGREQLAQAIRAGGRIGRNPGTHTSSHLAGDDLESRPSGKDFAGRSQFAHRDRVDARQGRRLGAQATEKGIHALFRPFDLDGDPAGVVADKARQALLQGQPVDKRTVANALHHAADQRRAPYSIWLGLSHQEKASHRRPA